MEDSPVRCWESLLQPARRFLPICAVCMISRGFILRASGCRTPKTVNQVDVPVIGDLCTLFSKLWSAIIGAGPAIRTSALSDRVMHVADRVFLILWATFLILMAAGIPDNLVRSMAAKAQANLDAAAFAQIWIRFQVVVIGVFAHCTFEHAGHRHGTC